jgi:hypothetical protein
VRVGPEICNKRGSDRLQPAFKRWTSAGFSHLTLQANSKRNLFEFRSVPIFAVIHRMHEFMHKGVQYLDGVGIDWRNMDLVDAII